MIFRTFLWGGVEYTAQIQTLTGGATGLCTRSPPLCVFMNPYGPRTRWQCVLYESSPGGTAWTRYLDTTVNDR